MSRNYYILLFLLYTTNRQPYESSVNQRFRERNLQIRWILQPIYEPFRSQAIKLQLFIQCFVDIR